MEALIPVLNKLQEVFATVGYDEIQLPQIVVVGSQSSGKSSVLESLVGRSFLPRGVGIVTRCPLVLQMIHCPLDNKSRSADNNTLNCEEFATFLHMDRIFTDFEEVRAEIEAEMDKRAGVNKGICHDPIALQVYSPHVVNLTLVDLPGLTKVPVGEQPQDIDQRIESLVMQYIGNPNSIILAVAAANVDMSTSESLKLAREVDIDGRRTLAVITKLDLMDSGTDANDMLNGRVIPVELGIIGVVNRSQQDIKNQKSISDAVKSEGEFLQRKYPLIAQRHGSKYLAKTLNRLLLQHIRTCLPDLKLRINALISDLQLQLKTFGDDVSDKSRTLLRVINSFALAYQQTIDGNSNHIDTTELCGGARIYYIFNETFGSYLDLIEPIAGLTDSAIITAIRNTTGTRPAFFLTVAAFERLVKDVICRLEGPALRCVELVHEEMVNMIQHCGVDVQQELVRFPKLQTRIIEVVTQLLRNRLPTTNTMVENLVQIELAYINTKHPEFRGHESLFTGGRGQRREGSVPMDPPNMSTPRRPTNARGTGVSAEDVGSGREQQQQQQQQKGDTEQSEKNPAGGPYFRTWMPWNSNAQSTQDATNISPDVNGPQPSNAEGNAFGKTGANKPRATPQRQPSYMSNNLPNSPSLKLSLGERADCDTIRRLVVSYFQIVRKTIQDTVPKTVMHFMVNYVKENLSTELVSELYNTTNMADLLSESPDIAQHRRDTVAMLEAARKASDIIGDIRDTHIW